MLAERSPSAAGASAGDSTAAGGSAPGPRRAALAAPSEKENEKADAEKRKPSPSSSTRLAENCREPVLRGAALSSPSSPSKNSASGASKRWKTSRMAAPRRSRAAVEKRGAASPATACVFSADGADTAGFGSCTGASAVVARRTRERSRVVLSITRAMAPSRQSAYGLSSRPRAPRLDPAACAAQDRPPAGPLRRARARVTESFRTVALRAAGGVPCAPAVPEERPPCPPTTCASRASARS